MLVPIISKNKSKQILIGLVTIISMFIVAIVVYFSGGTNLEFDHLMYLPIIFVSLLCGYWAGLFYAIIGGLLLGPYMPCSINPTVWQTTHQWLFRMFFFIVIGIETGLVNTFIVRMMKNRQTLFSQHNTTNIPNLNILSVVNYDKVYSPMGTALVTIVIDKYERLIAHFSETLYNELLSAIYEGLNNAIPYNKVILSNNSNIFWLIIKDNDLKHLEHLIAKALRDVRATRQYQIYFEFSIGSDVTYSIKDDPKNETLFYKATENAFSAITGRQTLRDSTDFTKFDYVLLADIPKALENDEFFLMFQPLKPQTLNNTFYFEALIRWNHPTKGLIMPNDFIPLVENTMLINPLSLWVLNNTIAHIKKYESPERNIIVFINISPRNLNSTTFVGRVKEAFDIADFDTNKIKFEITESTAVNISQRTLDNLQALNNFKIDIAIDDFGQGHTSVSYLVELPIKYVKLDRVFLNKLSAGSKQEILFRNTVDLLKQLNIEIVAEGVETKEQYELLKEFDLDFYQGYCFSKPFDEKTFNRWVLNPPKEFKLD